MTVFYPVREQITMAVPTTSGSDNNDRRFPNEKLHPPFHREEESSLHPASALSADVVSTVKRRLWEETAQGLGDVVGDLRGAWYTGNDTVFYSRERERLRKYIPPFQYGLAASVFLFVTFRVTGNPGFQKWRKGVWQQYFRPAVSFAKQAPPPPKQQQQPPPAKAGYLETKRKSDVEKVLKSMKVLTDFFISLTVGTSGMLFLLEAKCGEDLRKDYEEAPLVAGRSLVADKMCPGMMELYGSDPRVRRVLAGNEEDERDRKWQERGMGDANLATFSRFLANCQKRADHEWRLRKERKGVGSENDPVLIPYTGVQ